MTASQGTRIKNKMKPRKTIDWGIFYIVTILVAIGVTMVFSASYVQSGIKYGDSLKFLKKNLLFAGGGFVVMYAVSKIDYKVYKKIAIPIMMINLILLAVTLTMDPLSGSKRWLQLPGTTFQTSELTKYACIIMTATIISNRKNKINHLRTVIEPLIYTGASIVLIMMQTDLSTSVTIGFVCMGMLFIAGARFLHIIGASFLALPVVAFKLKGYHMERLKSFLDPSKDVGNSGYQVLQSKYALACGRITGLGLGRSRQKFFYLPEPQNDFIFAIIGEELGYIGTIAILLLFTFLIGKCMSLIFKAPDPFGSMLAAGIALQIGIQVLVNVGVATGSLPNTGIALPFISYGGTSLLITMAAMGIILNISRHCNKG